MPELIKENFEAIAGDYPIYQYGFFKTDELLFSENVRYICKTECPMYGKSWSCPPACGTIEECKSLCMKYENGIIFSTVAEVQDASDLEETLPTRAEHTRVIREITERLFREDKPLLLSCESCSFCEKCAFPDAPCRFPAAMLPCIEGYGIVVTDLAERYNMDFYLSNDTVLWFGIILF